jgi:F-type H+-transporting ATPase subunit b
MALKHYWKVFSSYKTMDAMLHALGQILLRAVPTFFLILLLHFYLKSMFFRPMANVLQARYEATEGARKLAAESLERAAARTKEFERTLNAAKTEVYQQREQAFKELQEQHAKALAQARASAEAEVQQAKAALAADIEALKGTLSAQSDTLAEEIAKTLLRRSAA